MKITGKQMAGVAILITTAAASWLLWSRPLEETFDTTQPFTLQVSCHGENGTSEERFEVAPGSGEAAAVQTVLEAWNYHLCADSLRNDAELYRRGAFTVTLQGERGTLTFTDNEGKFSTEEQILQLEGGEDIAGRTICEALMAVVKE